MSFKEDLKYVLSFFKVSRKNLEFGIAMLGMGAVLVLMFYVYMTPDPKIVAIPPTLYWEMGYFFSRLFVGPSSIPIYLILLLWGIQIWRPKKAKPSTKEQIKNLKFQRDQYNLELRITRSRLAEKDRINASMKAQLNLVKERACPNCLAVFEGWLETEALV